MDYLLTAGLGSDDPDAAIMIYSQVLWALFLDWLIWSSHVNTSTIIGSIVVTASLVALCLVKKLSYSREGVLSTKIELDDIAAGLGHA